jgi:hypothetical protein
MSIGAPFESGVGGSLSRSIQRNPGLARVFPYGVWPRTHLIFEEVEYFKREMSR